VNADAKAFFQQNPQAKYWYYSDTLRVANPALQRRPDWEPDPWPEVKQ
jgi:hypothetical protein